MPIEKDFKRLVRVRMQKTGESYTAARLQLLKKGEPAKNYGVVAGMSDAAVSKQTGRTWAEWLRVLDAAQAAEKPHREIVRHVLSLGIDSWWSQMVTVGYERIRGLRDRGQRRGGSYAASKSRTFNVPVTALFTMFANGRQRRRWLPVAITVRSATPPKRMRIVWEDGKLVQLGFMPKGAAKSAVAVQHEKLPSRASVEAMKNTWSEHFDRLGQLLR